MDFFLFLLVNATLFIRPSEFIPALQSVPIYNILMVMNLLLAAPAIVNECSQYRLSHSSVTVCVLGIFVFVVLSHLARLDLGSAWTNGVEFAKVVAYFLLLVATVNTPQRLSTLLSAVAVFTLVVTVIAVLNYHGKIHVAALSTALEIDNAESGEVREFSRLRTTGIFRDPNDLAMIMVVSMLIFAGGLFYAGFGFSRLLLVAPLGFLGYALTLTHSRGGLLALLLGCGSLLYARFGMLRAGVLGTALIPLMLAGFGGRQVEFREALSSGTGKGRVEIWSDGLELFKASPVFGIGANRYSLEVGHVAHNSFVDAFVELGFFGGCLFLGLFATVGWSLWQMRRVRHEINHPGLRYFLPFMIAMLIAYSTSMMSLSRQYIIPTYLLPGVATVYERLARPGTSMRPLHVSGTLLTRLGVAGIGFMAFIYVGIKILYRMG